MYKPHISVFRHGRPASKRGFCPALSQRPARVPIRYLDFLFFPSPPSSSSGPLGPRCRIERPFRPSFPLARTAAILRASVGAGGSFHPGQRPLFGLVASYGRNGTTQTGFYIWAFQIKGCSWASGCGVRFWVPQIKDKSHRVSLPSFSLLGNLSPFSP